MKLCQIVLAGCLLAGAASAAVEEWTSINPAGPANAIGGVVVDLSYADSGEVYIVSSLGYLYKRAANNQPWVRLPVSVNGTPVKLERIEIAPGIPAVLLGDIGLARLIRSTDGGVSWSELFLPAAGGSSTWVRGMVAGPNDPDHIYYTDRDWLWHSNDGGQSWEDHGRNVPHDSYEFEVHPLSESLMYILSGGILFASADGGQSWGELMVGPHPDFVDSFGLDPTNLQTAYACRELDTYKTVDAATTWSLSGNVPYRVANFAIDPVNPAKVYAALDSNGYVGAVYATSDGGASWSSVTPAGEWIDYYHIDVSGTGEVVAGGSSGVWSSSDGTAFAQTNNGFNDFHSVFMAVAPSDDHVLYAAGLRQGVLASFDGGQTWSLRNDDLEPAGGKQIAVDPTNALHVFLSDINGLHESNDGGHTWQDVSFGPPWWPANSISIAPGDSNRMYVRSRDLLTSGDGGQTWTVILDGSRFLVSGVQFPVAVPDNEPSTIYLGTWQEGLFKSVDAGASWTAFTAGLPNLQVGAIALDPTDPQHLVIGLDNNVVMESFADGTSWTDISDNLPGGTHPIRWLERDHFNGDLYAVVGEPEGVYRRAANGGQWQPLGNAPFEYTTDSLQIIPSRQTPGRLYLQVREMFALDRDSDADGIADGADNCLNVANANQRDTDGDQFGNLCDPDIAPTPNDCQVNFLDLSTMKQNFFVAGDLDTDLNGDGQTNFADLTIMKGFFFASPGLSGLASCP